MPHHVTKIDKPWGYELIFAHTSSYAGKILVIEPGQELSRQYHEMKEETIYVIEGEMILETGDGTDRRTIRLMVGEGYHLPPRTIHRFSTERGCRLVEVSTPHLDDVVRLEDRYGRIQK
ncbi:MAG TPA: cupin domain-containing protein [Thermoanaerobaculia bacterium]|nr:cupin domain-containing protein [Thermoanaerobaculia bacterium]HUM29971.1 cupin domain-containing protein [Thermoanaerobaculia bacterium]HXK68162.1 cupin domain-containing protein [Thermoanaerobaculia bacterium]